jgi:hypothetical protein
MPKRERIKAASVGSEPSHDGTVLIIDDTFDFDPTPDPEWLAGLPPTLREAHDRMEQARISLRLAENRKSTALQEARSERDREIQQAREYMHLEIERATEQYNSAASRCDAQYGQKKQAAQEQYDQAQMQYAQSLQKWQDVKGQHDAGKEAQA